MPAHETNPQATDKLTLEEMLATIESQPGFYRINEAEGYRDGFEGQWGPPVWNCDPNFDEKRKAYLRGRRQGQEAEERGAHASYSGRTETDGEFLDAVWSGLEREGGTQHGA